MKLTFTSVRGLGLRIGLLAAAVTLIGAANAYGDVLVNSGVPNTLAPMATIPTSALDGNCDTSTAIPVTDPNPSWSVESGSLYISCNKHTGNPSDPSFVIVGPDNAKTTFEQLFTIPAGQTGIGGTLVVQADDTTSVKLDGVTLATEAGVKSASNTYAICSDVAIGCVETTEGNFVLPPLTTGVHNLTFDTFQRNDQSFGLDYVGTIKTQKVAVPEPGTASLILLSSGLLGLVITRRRGRGLEI